MPPNRWSLFFPFFFLLRISNRAKNKKIKPCWNEPKLSTPHWLSEVTQELVPRCKKSWQISIKLGSVQPAFCYVRPWDKNHDIMGPASQRLAEPWCQPTGGTAFWEDRLIFQLKLTVALSSTLMERGSATLCLRRACSSSCSGGRSHFPNTTRSMSLRVGGGGGEQQHYFCFVLQ